MTFHFKDPHGPLALEQPSETDEPRIQDIVLAERLGFAAPRQIRELIERNQPELETYGGLSCRTTNPGKQGGRPGKEYWLTEGQALVICALSRTPKAAAVRKLVIEVFMAWRREQERRASTLDAAKLLPPAIKVPHSVSIGFTADPDTLRIDAKVPTKVAFDFVGAFAAYQQTLVTGLSASTI